MAIRKWLNFGCVHVVDADIADCFGSIVWERLEKLVARRIADGYVLALIWAWLRAGLMEGDQIIRTHAGVAQGEPISPLLCNIYLHELDRTWVERGTSGWGDSTPTWSATAMKLVIDSSKPVAERMAARLAEILGGLGLTLSRDKTWVTPAAEGFDFLSSVSCGSTSRSTGRT